MKILIISGKDKFYRELSGKELETKDGALLSGYRKFEAVYRAPAGDPEFTYNHVLANILIMRYPKCAEFVPELTITEDNIYPEEDTAALDPLTEHRDLILKFINDPTKAQKPPAEYKFMDGVLDEWYEVIYPDKIAAILERIGDEVIEPSVQNILAPFKTIKPAGVQAVLFGQDPYPENAVGYAFAKNRADGISKSMENVFKCLKASGLIADAGSQSPDIRFWTAQGILLINCAWTTRHGRSDAHKTLWSEYIKEFVPRMLRAVGHPITFILWGSRANTLIGPFVGNNKVLKWSHPSPLGDNLLQEQKRFVNCTNFKDLIAEHKGLKFDSNATVYAFADGSCTGNGTAKAAGASAVYFRGSFLNESKIQVVIEPCEYYYDHGIKCHHDKTKFPTVARVELLAICYALEAINRVKFPGTVKVYSDSETSIKLITEYLPKREEKGTADLLQNLDLLSIISELKKMDFLTKLEFKHMRASHGWTLEEALKEYKSKAKAGSDIAKLTKNVGILYSGNVVVDTMAKAAKENRIISSVPGLQTMF